MNQLIKKPTAWIPLLMSLTALAILVGFLMTYGIVHETDEGAAAHLFQLLMGGQLPIIAYFAISWLPREPKRALVVLALQFVAGLIPMALLFYFEHIA